MLNFNLLDEDDVESETDDLLEVEESTQDIAIIGLSAQLPLVADLEQFWEFMCNGVDFVSEFPQSRRRDMDIFARNRREDNGNPDYYEGAYLDEVDKFDYSFFRLSPKEASLMSPNQRLFLQTAWKSLEDAGYSSMSLAGSRTGVFIGFNADSLFDYKGMISDTDPELLSLAVPGNINSIIAGRISYLLDLRGPSLCVDTACSSSLVAVHLACQSIRNQECEMAIAGSVKINLLPLANEVRIGIESSTWRARSFDDSSDGTGAGEGVVAFVLKPLHKALQDGDSIHAVIKGSAVNQDGSSIGMTAPNVIAQEDVIIRAWNNAGIDPTSISYIEAHGTGTKLGDPIEIAGIERAFRKFTNRKQFVAIGSIKANIGHLDHAAGAVGLLKSILALKNKQLPPLVHFSRPNHSIDFIDSPVYINNRLTDWEEGSTPRRCGISAFGMSGTNCHLVLEEAPVEQRQLAAASDLINQAYILTMSAKTEDVLMELVGLYAGMKWKELNIADVCFVANTGRDHHAHRLAIVVEGRDELIEKLRLLLRNGSITDEKQGIYYGYHKPANMEGNRIQLDGKEHSEIAQLYVQGANVDWSRLYTGRSNQKVHLPTYPFAKSRCWIDADQLTSYNTVKASHNTRLTPAPLEVKLLGRDNGIYTTNEYRIAQIWGATLGFKQLNIDDNFFELGGDSILALKIVNEISTQLSIHTHVSDLFKYTTIEQLAVYVDTALSQDNGQFAVWSKLVSVEPREYYPLTSSQFRLFIQEQLGARGTENNTPFCIMVEGVIDQARFNVAFQALVARHEALRTSFHYKDGEAIQLVTQQVDFQVSFNKCSEDSLDAHIRRFIRPFDLECPPLIRVGLITVHSKKHLMIIDMHHLICDGVSSSILIKEFCDLYRGVSLPELNIQYKDYAVWQTNMLSNGVFQSRKEYWINQLSKALPLLQMPTDYMRPEKKSFNGDTLRIPVDAALKLKLERLANNQGLTMNTLLFSIYTLMLHDYTNQDQLVVGTLVAGRSHPELEHVMGMFINFLPIRLDVDRSITFAQFLKLVNATIVEAYEYEYPFDQMIVDMQIKTDRSRNPLYDTMFIYHNEYNMNPTAELHMDEIGLTFTEYPLPNFSSSLDMKLDVWNDTSGQLVLAMQYDTSLFTAHSMNQCMEHLLRLAEYVIDYPDIILSQIAVKLEARNELELVTKSDIDNQVTSASKSSKVPLQIVISSTFTAEPISDYVSWWCQQFNMQTDITFAAYHQVFQELLNPSSLLSRNEGINILLIRFEDWIRDELSSDLIVINKLEGIYTDLQKAFGNRISKAPHLVCTFPISSHALFSNEVVTYIEALNERWRQFLTLQEQVFIIDYNDSMAQLYQVPQVFDPVKDREGHLPFTDEFYSVIGTEVARRLVAWNNQSFKVIVLDCDNTLWRGVCGEEGPLNVEVSGPYIELQKFMLERYNEGMLLAISSKNNESDVWEVFANHPDMLLKREHFVATRINWNAKSANVEELARQLNVGLDSFIFIDDSPMECSEMMQQCPSVLTLQLPVVAQQIPAYLQHVWAFDKLLITEEDRKRTTLYVAESKRQYEWDHNHSSMEDFLSSLDLRIRITSLTMEQVPRAAQLTQRTNQFNMSTIRRSEAEIHELLTTPHTQCWAVEVDDRFGEYGFVGLVISRTEQQSLVLDTFLLSCRVLGRQVEHTILSELSTYAKSKQLIYVEAPFVATAKNAPFKQFLDEAGWQAIDGAGGLEQRRLLVEHIPEKPVYITLMKDSTVQVELIDAVHVELVDTTRHQVFREVRGETASSADKPADNWDWDVLGHNMDGLLHRYQLLPLLYPRADQLMHITISHNSKYFNQLRNQKVEYDGASNERERELIEIWEQILHIQAIGVDDHFFDIGGNSLQAVSLASRIHQQFHVQFSLRDLLVAPTIRQLARLIERTGESIYTSIVPIPDRDGYPVTSAQKRLLVLNELDGASTAYNQPCFFQVNGPLNIVKLEYVCSELIRRHQALRTTFLWEQGEFVQHIQTQVDFTVEAYEMGTTPFEEWIQSFIRPFVLTNAPLFRAGVVSKGVDSHLLLFDMHHVISDGVSISVLLREFLELYQGNSLPELRIQYRDYAVWQQAFMHSEHMREQEQYWLDLFADGIPILNLPLDLPRPAIRQFDGSRYSLELDDELHDAVEQLASSTGTTPYMVYLAAYNILLAKYSGQNDIVVGSPVAGRPHTDLDPIIGMFVQTLVLRNKPEGHMSFLQFVANVKESTLQAFEHQDYPFEELIDKLKVQRDLSRNPMFDTMFVYQNMSWTQDQLEHLQFQMYPYNSKRSRFDLTLELAEYDHRMSLNLEYTTGIFHQGTIERFAQHFLNIVRSVTRAPHLLLSQIDMLAESEVAKLLFGFNATQVEYESDLTIQQRFEEQAVIRPDDIAVVYEQERLTYSQLNHRANRLAGQLRSIGGKPNQIVGIQVERSIAMVVAVLGVLKSGSAYMPIDPQYPVERIQYMLEDSLAEVVITHSRLAQHIPSHIQCIFVDDEQFTEEQLYNLPLVNTSSDLAYIIYTSGSTGKPKGVMIEHKGMMNLQVYFQEKLGVTNMDRIVQFASLSFDASVWEMFMGLFNGAQLHLLSQEVTNNYNRFEQYLNEQAITIATLPPTYLVGLHPDRLDTLCKVITAGSASTLELLEKWSGKIQYMNAYGPTESTICASVWEAPNQVSIAGMSSVPIGSPIPNTQLYIVNSYDQLQPIGVPGELCIGGAGLARGYLHRSELTAKQFVANPFITGMRMYRTGDLARWLPSGSIEYMGRIDDQVKIRGYRIELGEVEGCILKHPQVEQCIVVARAGIATEGVSVEAGDSMLCAYLGVGEHQLEVSSIRSFIGEYLPEYMVPTYFVMMAQLPLTMNGKIDKLALPEPEATRSESYVAPNNNIEHQLTQMWVDILGIERIGIKDHFFELGGHSLKAIAMLTRIHQEFQVEVSLQQIFRCPTIELLAQEIANARPQLYTSIPRAEPSSSYPLSSGQRKLYVLQQLEGVDAAYNITGAYWIEGDIDHERLEYAFHALIQRHEALRTSFAVEDGEFIQYIHDDVQLTIQHLETSMEQLDDVVKRLITRFDLSVAPLMRVAIVKVNQANRYVLFVDMHHIISDGMSTNILIHDLLTLYEGSEELPELRIQYKDYAIWQQQAAAVELTKQHEEYWINALSGAGEIPVLTIPTDFNRPPIQNYEGSRIQLTIEERLTESLRAVAIASGSTLYMVLLCGYYVLLSKYSGQEDIIIGTPTAGRTHADLQHVMGMFVNTLALRNQPVSKLTFSEFLEAVKLNTIQAFDHQDYPFDLLLEKLNRTRDVSRNPLFDAMFILQNFDIMEIKADQLSVEVYPFTPSTSKFDLSLEVLEGHRELLLSLDYAVKLYREETVTRMLADYVRILSEIALNPSIKLLDIQLIERTVRRNQVLSQEIEFNF